MRSETRSEMSHRDYAQVNAHFRSCCREAKVEPTKRQAAKFRRGEGTAYKFKRIVLEKEAAFRRGN